MKSSNEVVACVIDYGTFVSLADKLGETYSKVFYYTPRETEYCEVARCVIGDGIPNIEHITYPLDVLEETDLFIFPDIGYTGLQEHIISLGKAVWGSRRVTEYELRRSDFLGLLAEVGLPVPKSKVIRGLRALKDYLKRETRKWIKVDIYRANMETWFHVDHEHSVPMIRYLELTFGGIAEDVVFVAQDPIDNAAEVGYDGFSIDGMFPEKSFQGYEKKNELYLGTWQTKKELPEEVQMVNEAMAEFLKESQYRNFWATEIRNEFFIDPTPRMAGQTQEHLLETCVNLADIIWAGANGELVEPEFKNKFAAEATLHYNTIPDTEAWRVVHIPDEIREYFKLYKFCRDGETYYFPPENRAGKSSDEVGVVIGCGDTIEDAISDLKSYLKMIEDEPVHAEINDFVDILKDLPEGFADYIPDMEEIESAS